MGGKSILVIFFWQVMNHYIEKTQAGQTLTATNKEYLNIKRKDKQLASSLFKEFEQWQRLRL